ncbi:hypothetical protein [Streptomyces sp. NPDC049555]|uniref:hypothetical protein n=1 Tax=unclassified Streptomyces TaxID=2593676 RepID=UPI00343948EC
MRDEVWDRVEEQVMDEVMDVAGLMGAAPTPADPVVPAGRRADVDDVDGDDLIGDDDITLDTAMGAAAFMERIVVGAGLGPNASAGELLRTRREALRTLG